MNTRVLAEPHRTQVNHVFAGLDIAEYGFLLFAKNNKIALIAEHH